MFIEFESARPSFHAFESGESESHILNSAPRPIVMILHAKEFLHCHGGAAGQPAFKAS